MASTTVAARGQIWWVEPDVDEYGPSSKMKKVRPWIVISPNNWNYISSGYMMFPITHNFYKNSRYKLEIDCPTRPGKAFSKSWIICYMPRIVDETELKSYIGCASEELVDHAIDVLNQFLMNKENIEEIDLTKDLNEETIEDIPHEEIFVSSDNIINIDQSLSENNFYEDEAYPGFRKYYPNPEYYDRYYTIKSSLEVKNIIDLYHDNPTKFCKNYKVNKTQARRLCSELDNYYNYIIEYIISSSNAGSL